MGYSYNSASSFNAVRTGYASPMGGGSYESYAASSMSQMSSAYGTASASSAGMVAMRGGFGAVDSFSAAASAYGSYGLVAAGGLGFEGLSAYAANYYSSYQQASAWGGGYEPAMLAGAFNNAFASGAINANQYQQVQGWGQDIYGMQSALGGYAAYNSYQGGLGASATASVEALGKRYTATFGASADAGWSNSSWGASSMNGGSSQFNSFREENI